MTADRGVASESVVGGSPWRVGGRDRVTGRQAYVADLRLDDVLHVKLVTVDAAHARIGRIDASRALALPGVRFVMTPADLPSPMPRFGPQMRDRPVLAVGETKYHGDPVAAVAAETRDLAEEAAALVDVEFEALPAVAPSPPPSTPRRRSSRTRRSGPTTRSPAPTSCASTASAGATSRRRSARPRSSSRAPTRSRWSPSSPSSRTRSWRRPTATGSRSGARSSTPTGSSASWRRCSSCRWPRSGSSRPTRAAASAASSTPSTSRCSRSWPVRAGRPVRLVLSLEETFQAVRRAASEIRVRSGFHADGTLAFRDIEANYLVGRVRGHRRPRGRQGHLHLGRAVQGAGRPDRRPERALAHRPLDRLPRLRQPAADLGGRIEHGRGGAPAGHRPARAAAPQPRPSRRPVHARRHRGRRRVVRDRRGRRPRHRLGHRRCRRGGVAGWPSGSRRGRRPGSPTRPSACSPTAAS